MTLALRRRLLLLSIFFLIISGYVLARYLGTRTNIAWAYVTFFYGAFIVGATWWYCLRKTRSLKGAIITHFFLIDVTGMAAYVLANKLTLVKLPF